MENSFTRIAQLRWACPVGLPSLYEGSLFATEAVASKPDLNPLRL
jgi:hypothetical protein